MSDAVTTPPIPTGDVQWPRELDGEYEWIGELGRGGMAIVYHARDRELRREVAVKVVRTRYAHDHEAVARLAREARTVARLEHPNIVALHAVKRLTDDSLALVMQLVPGRTLKQALQADGAFNADRVERVLRDISRALAYAHGHGVVHRDVKPENIFLDAESGRALLSDFGVAISREADTSLTATGTAIGTPTYMSPEQIDGTRVDGRSDLYSLGLVAWEMLTGKRPWDGEGLYNVIYKQKHEELPGVEEFRSNVSERLRYLVDGLLRKQPDARWPSAERLLLRLNDASDPPGLRQWRQYKRRQLKQRRELEQTLPNEGDPTDAATAHFRRSETQRAALDARVDAGTPQIIDVEQSPLAPDAWRVQDDEESPRRPLKRWLAAAAALLVAGSALAVVLTRGNGEDVANAADTRTTFSDMGTIQVPVQAPPASTRSDSTPQVVRDTLGGRAPREPLPKTAAATPEPPPRAPPAVARQRIVQPTTPPVVAAAPAQRDSSPAPPPNEPPATPSLSFPAERALVAVGARHSCAIEAGRARCWGNNENGQLGDGSLERQPIPAAVAGDFSFAQLAAGESFTCGVTTAGEGLCWGSNESGELGDGTSNMRNAPVRVSGGHTFRLIRTGLAHACGLTRSGRIVCWGSNRFGQLGDGARGGRTSPVSVSLPGPAAQVAANGHHSCALLLDGSAYCWGQNSGGQLGDGSRIDRAEPARVATPQRFVSIASGRQHTCAVTPEGEAYCWGRNSRGEAGIGEVSESVMTPQRVDTEARFSIAAAGLSHTCARTTGGAAYCWGHNAYGQLGNGSVARQSRPVRVSGVTGLVALYAGGSHTCGVTATGETLCWGYNVDGQLGDGGRENSLTPVKVQQGTR